MSTPVPDAAALAEQLSLEDKITLLTGADTWSTHPMPRIGLRPVVTSDGPAGVRGRAWDERATTPLLPNASALAATWDPPSVSEAGRLLGEQASSMDIHVLLAPTVNLHRSPLSGRHFECFAEDPLLTERMAIAYITGVQSRGVAATIKHYVGNESETERFTYDAHIDERTLREVYLRPFEAAVRAGVWGVMAAYNGVNGATMTENRRLLTDVLKDEWGFDGVAVSDWFATRSTEASANAGLDLVMPGPNGPWRDALLAAVRQGRVSEQTIDDKVVRLLRLAIRVGAVAGEKPPPDTGGPDRPRRGDEPATRSLLRRLASESAVLLRNDGTLPLNGPTLGSVAVIGPNAVRLTAQGGGSAQVNPPHVVSVPEGLRAVLGEGAEITVHHGVYRRRTPALDVAALRDPVDEAPGMRVEFLTTDGHVLDVQHRATSRFIFMRSDLPAGTARIVATGEWTAPASGDHEFFLLGAGECAARLGSAELADRLVPRGKGLIAAAMRPGRRDIALSLDAGATLPLELSHVVDGTSAFAVFGLGHRPPRPDDETAVADAVRAAAGADVAVVVVGTDEVDECEAFDRATLALPDGQDELVSRVAAANPRTVVVVNAGAPVLMPWRDEVAAVLWAWLPGQEGGAAIADVLTGEVELAGRLPTTFPAAEQDVPVLATAPVDGVIDYAEATLTGYLGYAARGIEPAFPFGHGLGYTTWAYESIAVTQQFGGGLTVTVTVRNTGSRPGREVVQCYLADDTELTPPSTPERLVGFAPLTAPPGESVDAVIAVEPRRLARYDVAGASWRMSRTHATLRVGPSAIDLPLAAEIDLDPTEYD